MKNILYFQSSICSSNAAEMNGVYRFAKTLGWHLTKIPFGEAEQHRLRDQAAKPDVHELIRFWNAEGAIVDCGGAPDQLTEKDFGRTPVVFLDHSRLGSAPCVVSDSEAIATEAAHDLLISDCATYAYVPWMEPLDWSVERGEIFEKFIRLHHKPFERFVLPSRGNQRHALTAWLKSLPGPVGVFAANDYVAAIVIECARAAGLSVPKDVSVLGVDNDEQICTHTNPPLTSIHPDHEHAGYMAGELLADCIRHPRRKAKPVRTFGPLETVWRKSVQRVRSGHMDLTAVIDLIRAHACDGLQASEVITAIGGSRRSAEMKFREATGRSILQEIRSVRLEHAKTLLRDTDLSIAEIAGKCGYTATEPLRKLFLASTGCSPDVWRRRS